MNTSINVFNDIVTTVTFLFNKLKIKVTKSTGRPLAITPEHTIALALFKQAQGIETKKSVWEMFEPKCSYKTLVVNMNITTDLNRQLLAVRFGTGNSNDRETFKKMNKDLMGIFVADSGYISKDLEREFYIEHKRILFVKPRANMKKIATEWQIKLYNTRMLIELNFRSLKMFYKLATSLPRSIDGYLGNYVYSLLAFVL